MAEVIDFKSALKEINDRKEESIPHAGDEIELSYDPKPNSVGVLIATDADGVAHFTITAPAEDVGPAIESAKAALLANFGVMPGDEKGEQAVRDTMGEATYDAFITSFVQEHFFAEALTRTVVMPFLDPDLLTSEPPEAGKDYTFKVDALLRPSFELTSYDPVEIEVPKKTEVTSKDITEYLNTMSEELATWEEDPTRDEAAEGDRVTLNIDATTPDGKTFEPLTGRHVPYVIGTGSIGEEFDQTLVGMKPRERRELTTSVPVPSDDGSINYQVVDLKIQLDTIQHKVPAVIDDGWVAKNMPEAQTLLGLRSRIRTMLERDADLDYHNQLMDLTANELATRLIGEPDQRYIDKMRDELEVQFYTDLQHRGIDYQEFLNQPGFDREGWDREMLKEAEAALRRGFALDSLADHLDIQLTEEDIAKVVAQMAPGREVEALQGILDSGQMPRMCEVALRTRANEWLVDNLKEKNGPKLQLV